MKKMLGLITLLSMAHSGFAAEAVAEVANTGNDKTVYGEVLFEDTPYGLLIIPHLSKLPSGAHGLHFHQHPDCDNMGDSAGGHYDPKQTNSHQGPYGEGHLGDLPVLFVTADGVAQTPILAPRLKVSNLQGLALMVHANGDNYTDTPPLGGGGARLACGVVKSK